MNNNKCKPRFTENQVVALWLAAATAVVAAACVIASLTVWRFPDLGLKFGKKIHFRLPGQAATQIIADWNFGEIVWGDAVYTAVTSSAGRSSGIKRRQLISVVSGSRQYLAYRLDGIPEEDWILVRYRWFPDVWRVYRREGVTDNSHEYLEEAA